MKFLFAVLFVSLTPSAFACNPVSALRAYYVGPEMSDFRIAAPVNGVYSLSWSEEEGVKCTGAKARVNEACEVEVVQAAFCDFR